MPSNPPDPIDIHVGSRVRLRRKILGMGQPTLGNKIGVAFQQIQKYEKGTNRIAASRLYRLGKALEVPITYFFDSLESANTSPAMNAAPDLAAEREAAELLKAYFNISAPKTRKNILNLLHSLAAPQKQKRKKAA